MAVKRRLVIEIEYDSGEVNTRTLANVIGRLAGVIGHFDQLPDEVPLKLISLGLDDVPDAAFRDEPAVPIALPF